MQVPQEFRASTNHGVVAEQRAVDVGEGKVAEQHGYEVLGVKVARERYPVWIGPHCITRALHEKRFNGRDGEAFERNPGFVEPQRSSIGAVVFQPNFGVDNHDVVRPVEIDDDRFDLAFG